MVGNELKMGTIWFTKREFLKAFFLTYSFSSLTVAVSQHHIMLYDKTYLHNFDPQPARGQEELSRGNSESFRLFVESVIFFCPFVRDVNCISLCSSEELTIFCIGIYMFSTHGRRPLQIKYKKLLCLCRDRKSKCAEQTNPQIIVMSFVSFYVLD